MIHFTVPGMTWQSKKKLQEGVVDGYYSQGKTPNWQRMKRYQAWKERVQNYAAMAGLELPLRPTKAEPVYVVTMAYFQSGVHPDPGNVYKGVVDALCYVSAEGRKLGEKRGSDKWVGGGFEIPRYDKNEPRVEVYVLGPEEWFGFYKIGGQECAT